MTVNDFNMTYSEKYGKVLLLGGDNRNLLSDYYYINDKLNEYYLNKKMLLITSRGHELKTLENLNKSLIRKAPNINIYITDKNETNAFAGKISNEYCIGILHGTLKNMHTLFDFIVNDESFSNIERIGIVKKDIMINKLNQICIDFLSMHEFFHIMNGHCDLIKKLGFNVLCEKNDEDDIINSDSGLIMQTLEYDADCCAITSIINEEIRSYIMAFQASGQKISAIGGFYESFIDYTCMVVISIYTLYHKLDSKKVHPNIYSIDELMERKHPLAGLRIWYIILNIESIISGWKLFDEEQVKNITTVIPRVLFNYTELNKDIVSPRFLKEILVNNVYLDHMQKIHDNWEVVRNMIDSNYVGLAPYSKFTYKKDFLER